MAFTLNKVDFGLGKYIANNDSGKMKHKWYKQCKLLPDLCSKMAVKRQR